MDDGPASENDGTCVIMGDRCLSMAEYLTASPDAPVFVAVLSVISSMILAIPKSQINGMALPVCGQPVVREPDVNTERTS